jgi:predicted  nucleic acid-binding Zn-ribbon protein
MSRHRAAPDAPTETRLAEQIDELARRAALESAEDGPEARLNAISQALQALRDEIAGNEGGFARVDNRLSDVADHIVEAIADAQKSGESHVDEIAHAVDRSIAAAADRQRELDERHDALLARLEQEAESVAQTRAQLIGELEGTRAALTPAVEAAHEQIEQQAQQMTGQVTAAVLQLLEDRLGAATAELTMQRQHMETMLTRLEGMVTGASAATGALDDTRRQLLDEIATARGELQGTAGVMVGAQAVLEAGVRRIQTSGDALVHYLDDRDLALEAERDRILRDVLEEFAETMRAHERRGVARRLAAVVDRRKDARDASRWRRTHQQAPRPELGTEQAAPSVIDLDAAMLRRSSNRR